MTFLHDSRRIPTNVAEDLLDGRYRLTDLLHRAEATDTWRAHDCRLGREVVIELLYAPGEPVSNPDQLQATLNERYSHLAHVYDAGSLPGRGAHAPSWSPRCWSTRRRCPSDAGSYPAAAISAAGVPLSQPAATAGRR